MLTHKNDVVKRLVILLILALLVASAPNAAASNRFAPLPGKITRGFDKPANNWEPGHRGVDISGAKDDRVVAAAGGKVTFVGQIAGVPMVTVTHADGLRSTYQPVASNLRQGDQISAGTPIGRLVEGHPGCSAQACLHWGLLRGDEYLDPTAWLGRALTDRVRLLPMDAKPKRPSADFPLGGASGPWPVAGVVTSEFGYRTHPITGASDFHDGTDIAAPCGTPVRAWSGGVIAFAGPAGGYGNRVVLQESPGNETSYSHLQGFNTSSGSRVNSGDIIGFVGTTGTSTGCHLHFSAKRGGNFINPRQIVNK